MPPVDWGWLITPDELSSWILLRTDDLLVLNKPPHTVCHPSRYGPWSSLIGACREYLGVERLHMPFRLDRETSGVLVFAQTRETGVRLQHAVMQGRLSKEYIAIVEGNLNDPGTVSEPIGPDEGSAFFRRQSVRARRAVCGNALLPTGTRKWLYVAYGRSPRPAADTRSGSIVSHLGHPIAGDKLYGRDPELMLEFIRNGFSEDLLSQLPIRRQALHCRQVTFCTKAGEERFEAPLSPDLHQFWQSLKSRYLAR